MGGKQWARQEELVFWKEVVPRSPKRVGADRQRREMSWKDCAAWMQHRMAKEFKEPRRAYTELCLYKAGNGQGNGESNGEGNGQGNGQGDSDGNDIDEEPQTPEPLGNAGPHIPMTPVRPRSLTTQRAKNTDHQEASPSSMSPFVPGYNNSDGYASLGSQASTPSYTRYAGHLHHPKPNRMPLGPSGMSTAPTMPMAPMDEEELPSLAGLHTASPYGHDSPDIPGQYSEVNSSPPMQMPQAMRHHSAIERQAASAGMSVQDLLNSSPAKQRPLPQAYQGSVNNGYGFQSGYNYHPSYVQGLGYSNGYPQNYTSSYGSAYGQGYNNGVQSYNQGYDSSPQGHNNGVQSYNQGYDSSPQGHNNGVQSYNQGYDSSPQGHNNGVQSYNQGYDSSPTGLPRNRTDDESFATRTLSSNATRSAHEGETYNNEYHGSSNDNSYQNSSIPNGDGEQSTVYSSRGPQKSMNRA
ncbi:hypothetical protein N0V85_000917 [Neurospora sp. IMI 360204]|nr:hypothetical protein N0V85_000917 [Neurospora sp. IMI 360204]